MAAFNRFNALARDLMQGKHALDSHTLKLMLTNVAPVAGNAVKTDITEIAAANGYTAGGFTVPFVSLSIFNTSSAKLVLSDVTVTASGGAIATFQYCVLYNASSGTLPLIGWVDNGSPVTLSAGQYFVWDADQVNGLLQMALA